MTVQLGFGEVRVGTLEAALRQHTDRPAAHEPPVCAALESTGLSHGLAKGMEALTLERGAAG